MTVEAVIGAIAGDHSEPSTGHCELSFGLVEQGGEPLAVMATTAGQLMGQDGTIGFIDTQMQLAPSPTLAGAVGAHLPFPSPKTLRPELSATRCTGPLRRIRGEVAISRLAAQRHKVE